MPKWEKRSGVFVKTSKKLDEKKSFSKEFVYGDLNVFGSYNGTAVWFSQLTKKWNKWCNE